MNTKRISLGLLLAASSCVAIAVAVHHRQAIEIKKLERFK